VFNEWKALMRKLTTLLVGPVFFCIVTCVLANPQGSGPEAPARFAERAAAIALDFRQGDLASLLDARPLFTESGWADFMKRLAGSLDPSGAATFTSTFTPSGPAMAARQGSSDLAVTVPGVLKHESRNPHGGVSTTSYRAEIDIRVAPGPLRVDLLVQRTCGGATTRSSCR
jgi:hypothetical protein